MVCGVEYTAASAMYFRRVTPDDSAAPTRRGMRERGRREPSVHERVEAAGVVASASAVEPAGLAAPTIETGAAPAAAPSTTDRRTPPPARTALTWVGPATLTHPSTTAGDLSAAASGYLPAAADLLGRPPRRSPWRPGVLVPTSIIAILVAAYVGAALLWPLHAVAPTIEAQTVQPIAAAAAAPAWPGAGSAGVAVAGIPGTLASSDEQVQMASIAKVVTALVVLEEMPLGPGEAGPEYRFTGGDSDLYWTYRENNESALDVPVGGTLTEYQLLQGMLIGSANNYADRLAGNLWPSDRVYADAANRWLAGRGVTGITIVDPTGIDPRNNATPAALIALAEKALANPVVAEIVATAAVELPGAGLVQNTNGMLADPGVVGVKTGSLDAYTLLTAKNVTVGDTTVRLYASVLGQPDDESRLAATRALFAQTEAELQPRPSVTAGTTVGVVRTVWGESVEVASASDADVILWNGGTGSVSTTLNLGDARAKGDVVGSLTVAGPLDTAAVDVRLTGDIDGPSPWWRLTHPLQLLGLAG